MRAELRVLRRGPVVMALALTTIGFGGVFTVFTYIVPILRDVTHGSTGYVTAMLMLFGVGATIGNAWGGRLADRLVDRALTIMLLALPVTLLAFTVLMRWHPRCRRDPDLGRRQLRHRTALADASDGCGGRRAEPRLRDEHRRVQPRQRDRRGIGWRGDRCRIGSAIVSLAGAAMAVVALAMLLTFRRQPRAAACTV